MEHRQPQRGENGRRPRVGLDALHDRCQGEELAWRVRVEQLVDQIGCAVDDREPVTSPCSRGAPSGTLVARSTSSGSSSPWRASGPPRISRQTVQR